VDAGQPYARGIVSALGVVVCALGTVVLAACGSTSATDITTPGAVRCAATVSAPSTVVPASGGPVSVTVSAARDCTWSAESQASWLKLATTSGQGTATISVNAATNDAASARSGSVTVNDQRLDFNQEGRGCSISLSGPDGAVAAAGVSQSLTITTLSGCPWTIAPSAPWVVPEVTSGSGTATVAYVVQPNAGGAREATLAVGAATFLVSQAAAPAPVPAPVPAPACTFTLSAASADFRPVWAWVQLWPLSGCWTSAATSRVGGMSHGLVDPTTITAEMAVQIRIWRVDEERIELNDNTLYSGEPGRRDLPKLKVSQTLEQVNQQLREGKYAEVTDWVSKNWLGRQQECYQPLGDLFLKFPAGG